MTKRKRREYGTGSLYQRADGMWIGTFDAGFNANGTRRRVQVSSKNEGECKRKLRDKQREFDRDGDVGISDRMTVKAWSETWLPLVERELTPKAFGADRSAVKRWIIPTIGHKRLAHLTPADVRAVANAQREAGRAGSTQLRTHSVLLTMLKAAILEGYTVPARVLAVNAPRKSVSDRSDMALTEAIAVLGEASRLPHGSRFVSALLQATRQGESLGLTWPEVDFERERMTISWQLQPLPYRVRYDRTSGFRVPDAYECIQLVGAMHLVRPKSEAGWRVVPMVSWMSEALQAWREIAPESPHGLVWPNPDGSPVTSKDDDRQWYDLQAAAGVHHPTRVDKDGKPRPYTIHETRHTTVTLLLEAGVDPTIITQIVGHSSLLSTKAYKHVNIGPARAALDAVAGRLQALS